MEIRDGLPPTNDGMVFEDYELDMEIAKLDRFTKEDLFEVLKLMGKIRIGVEPFNQLPDSVKKHFVVYDRYGGSAKYLTAIRKQRKQQREKDQK